MPKVKISTADLETFTAPAAGAGVPVADWLASVGRQQALIDAVTSAQPRSRILFVPVDAQTSAALDREAERTGTRDWVYAARLVRDVVCAPALDPDQLWADVVTDLSMMIASAQQRAYIERSRIETIVGDTVLLAVPDSFTRDVVESRLRPSLAESLSRLLGRSMQVAVRIDTVDPHPVRQPAPASAGKGSGSRDEVLREALEIIRGLEGRFGSTAA
ncbi:hypothetical protein FB565_003000 [Actinoplanes lutulentus]|nr:hypothetical protein [Actinoplanes lutulentus]MBB2943287.1 hypothetical protein [Actinoplanes lutulentus]